MDLKMNAQFLNSHCTHLVQSQGAVHNDVTVMWPFNALFQSCHLRKVIASSPKFRDIIYANPLIFYGLSRLAIYHY